MGLAAFFRWRVNPASTALQEKFKKDSAEHTMGKGHMTRGRKAAAE
jgi:hypothetical protein